MSTKTSFNITPYDLIPVPLAVLAVRVKTSCLTPFLDSLETPPSFLYKLRRLCLDALSTLVSPQTSSFLASLFPPRALQVPVLPEPPFHTFAPAMIFQPKGTKEDEPAYTPPCLLKEVQEGKRKACTHLLRALSSLAIKGRVHQNSAGMIYLEVEERMIKPLLPHIREQGIERTPSGTRIALVLPKEYAARKGFGEKFEEGQEMLFTVTGCYSLEPALWPEMERVWYLTLDCPEGEELRKSYLLPAKLLSHPFFLTIAVKKRTNEHLLRERDLFRLNVSCHAA
jgi:hypothetical protein